MKYLKRARHYCGYVDDECQKIKRVVYTIAAVAIIFTIVTFALMFNAELFI